MGCGKMSLCYLPTRRNEEAGTRRALLQLVPRRYVYDIKRSAHHVVRTAWLCGLYSEEIAHPSEPHIQQLYGTFSICAKTFHPYAIVYIHVETNYVP